ncbi:MAG: GLPGLI family protein [Saprospiraceae bacterium]|nr:GLPGLI family protein [Saprospiraceae bacterium]
MRPPFIVLSLVALLTTQGTSAQSLSITYRSDFFLSNLLGSVLKTDTFSTAGTQTSIYRLNISNNKSEYLFVESRRDTAKAGFSFKVLNQRVIYKDFGDMVMYMQSVSSPNIVSREPMQFDFWNLRHEEVREILGYRCKKATETAPAGDDGLTAWYAPDIPVSDGPQNFYGLPGLILVVEHRVYSITALDVVSHTDTKPINLPQADAYVTPAEFARLTRPKKN